MKHFLDNSTAIRRRWQYLALAASLALPLPALAASISLATQPLATSTTSSVKPNVMFILDDSGSMAWDYLPDWANDTDPASSGSYPSAHVGYANVPALFRNNNFNGVAYNPAITYTPPVLYNADGTLNTTTYPNIGSPWTSVKDDAYNIVSTGSTNLVTSFPDVEWCTSSSYTNCLRNDNLLLPDTVGGVSYTYSHSRNSTGTGNVATGSPFAPTTAARTFGPFYYITVPGEYCDSSNLKNCQSTQTATFSYPSTLRWCDSSALTNCQSVNTGTFKYPRYPTLFYAPAIPYSAAVPAQPAVASVTGVAASASFTFNFSGTLNPVALSIKVNGTEILSLTTPGSLLTSAQLAAWVQSHSSLSGYNITVSGSTVTVTSATTGTANNISSVVITETPANITATTSMTPGVDAVTAVTGVKASASFSFNNGSNVSPTGFSIKVNGTEILTSTAPGSQSSSGLASWVASHINAATLANYTVTSSGSTVTITAKTAVATTYDISSVVVSETTQAGNYVTVNSPTAGVAAVLPTAPSNGTLVITGVTSKNTSTSLKCGGTFIGTSAAYTSVNSNTASTRLTELYNKINGTSVNGYSISCASSTNPMACTVTPPAGASACSGGFTLANITTTTNTGPSGGSNAVTGVNAVGSFTFTNTSNISPTGFSIKVNGTQILTSSAPGSQSSSGLASWVVSHSSLSGYTISSSGSTVTITSNTRDTSHDISSIVVTSNTLAAGATITSPTYVAGVTPVTAVTAVKAVGTITFNYPGTINPTGFSIKLNGTEILSSTTPGALTAASAMDAWVAGHINAATLTNYVFTTSGSTLTITAKVAGTAWNINTIDISNNAPAFATTSSPTYIAGVDQVIGHPYIPAQPEILAQPATYYGSFIRTDIVSGNNSYPYPGTSSKAGTRTDCAGTTCTYVEEMTNFANWWTYYHTRTQAMKSSVSRAFKSIDSRFRVGFSTITYAGATNGSTFLSNDTFELAHKNTWFTTLFGTTVPNSTYLRRALSKAGRYYADKVTGQTDPVQYSCQQNFVILSTDGYWNDSDSEALNLTGGTVGDMDGGTTPRPMYEGPTATSDTLADVAKYYYDTDLRTSTLGNCNGGTSPDFPSGNTDVCTNNVFTSSTDNNTKQHMTTFTMGLGADGALDFTTDYQTATSGDYYNIKNGLGSPTANWSVPVSNTYTTVDDLWHAAVNGQGIYFSAKDPNQIITGLNKALSSITAKLGSAAAAATSTLNPVAGNNFAYVASYTTVKWTGNLEARSININDGTVSDTATWCAENIVAAICTSPGTVVANSSGSSTIYNCVVPGATAATCTSPGVFDSVASTCTTQIPNSCTGTMAAKVGALTDTRNIYTASNDGSSLVAFDATYATAHPAYFSAAHINGLNQWGTLTAIQQTAAAGVNLLNYLRGQNGYEIRSANIAANQLYRARETVLGDALESQPAYISKPMFTYPYPGYDAFKTANASRAGTVYMGTNDGMMHAFDASTGSERWAYVPSMVIGNLWKLASTTYDISHTNYVNGSPIISDICTANCTDAASAVWKTILVAGLNGGGRGYYALDVTDPNTPTLLWEFTTSAGIGVIQDDELGYSYGQPVISRKNDGTWVVLVTSGYNNTSSNSVSGEGFLYVLDAGAGDIISKIGTSVGSTTTPSGLSRIAGWNTEPAGNTVGFVYGGDLQGNLWRFNINSPTSADIGTGDLMKFATLFSNTAGTIPQPITTTPVLGLIDTKRYVFISTGKYLESSDLTTTATQSMYSIKDDDATSTLVNPRNTLVQQVISPNPDGTATRVSTSNAVNTATTRGCFADYPDSGERANIDSKLVEGILIAPTIVPRNTPCSPGGYGWLNYFNYKTCGATAAKSDSTIVGVNVIYIGGIPIIEIVTSTNPTPEKPTGNPPTFSNSSANFAGKRVIWHELIP